MKKQFSLIIFGFVSLFRVEGAVNVPLTVREAVYPGSVAGVARVNEPFCQGVPLPDSAGITNANVLGLSGATAGQFRILGTWPDGNAKWVEVCGVIPALTAGGTATVTLTGGSGNFGGSAMAMDQGSTIKVETGAAAFTIKKANFNGLETVTVGTTPVVLAGSSDGFVITGPAFPNTSCGISTPCATAYSSKNDSASTVIIEKNGPVEVVLKADWSYTDGSGNVYMQGTARMYFHQGKTNVKVTPTLRNAVYGKLNTFATAFKGFQAYELRTGLNLAGTLNYAIGNSGSTPTAGTMTSSDSVYIYQGQSKLMGDTGWSGCGNPCTNFTADPGYRIVKNGTTLASGTITDYPQGWADISNSSGVGVGLGAYQLAATGPKSLEFNSGGAVATIGLFARQNSFPVYQAWPQWKIDEVYLNFHASTPASLPNEFWKQQHYLVSAAARTQYNDTGVFLYTLPDPVEEDAYYSSTVKSASPAVQQSHGCCIQDVGTKDPSWPLYFYQAYWWNQGGARNQFEWRYSDLTNYISRGMTGRYIQAAQFYRMQAETMTPHADGFTWRSKPHANASSAELDPFGRPNAVSSPPTGTVNIGSDGVTLTLVSGAFFMPWEAGLVVTINNSNYSIASITDTTHAVLTSSAGAASNGVKYQIYTILGGTSLRPWSQGNGPDQEHMHWWGILDYYFMSGDETIRDAVLNSMPDWFLNPDTYQNGVLGGSLSGKVTTSGTSVTFSSGTQFAPYMAGNPIFINGVIYTVASVAGPTGLALTSSAGTQTVPVAYYALGGVWNARAIGIELSGAARFSSFLTSTGDPANAAAVLQQGANLYSMQVKPPLCASGYPAGCSYGAAVNSNSWYSQGISTTRGVHNTRFDAGIDHCNAGDYRAEGVFQSSILQQGIWELRTVEGPGWPDYMAALDLAYAQSQWALTEGVHFDGASSWTNNGFRYYVTLDLANGGCDATYWPVRSNATVWFPFFIQHQVLGKTAMSGGSAPSWQPILDQVMQRLMSSNGIGVGASSTVPDFGGYQLAAVIDSVNHPGASTLNTVPISGFKDNASGSYTISWAVPTAAQSYRIKWGSKAIVDWIGFDPANNVFLGDPVATMNWFAATDVLPAPVPSAAGATQTLTISTGLTGLTARNFSVKAYSGAGGTTPTVPAPATTVSLSSGNGQTGTAGTALPVPLTVKASDAAGNPVSGVSVTFAVASGGGTVSASQVTTSTQGLASVTLTLGATAGTNTVTASSGTLTGSPITFSATGTAASVIATNLAMVSGTGQAGYAGQSLPSPFVVQVTGSGGVAVAGITVTFAVTAGGGSLSGTQALTNAQGQASTLLTLGSSAGSNTVTATSGALSGSPLTFAATATIAPPAGTASVTWSKATPTTGWPTANGYMSMNWDPVSRKTIIYGHRAFSGQVSVAKGSNLVAWVSGDKFGDFWQPPDRISIGGTTYNISAPPTNAVTPPSTNNKTQLTLATGYVGATGTASYTAAESLIYSNDVMFYDAGANTWTWGPGTGAQQDLCIIDTPSMPGQRHPIGQMAIDTRRGYLWLTGGVNQSCTIQPVATNGTTTVTTSTGEFVMGTNWNGVTACIGANGSNCVKYKVDHVIDQNTVLMTTPVPAGQIFFRVLAAENSGSSYPGSKYDTYYLKLNSDATTDTWTQVPNVTHVPDAIVESFMTYDPDDDVLVLFGYDQGADSHATWIYCSTIGNSGGTLTAKQTGAGCARADDWTEVTTSCVGNQCIRNHPPGSTYPAMVWDTATHKVLQYGGTQGYLGTPQNVIFTYDVPSHTWTQKASVNLPPPIAALANCCLQSAATIAYNTLTQKLFYHHLGNNTSADYMYDPAADQWTMLGSPSAGIGATATNQASGQMAAFDAANNMIIGWNQGSAPDVWRGLISSSSTPVVSACDLNGDRVLNIADVQIAINQALGISPCGSADLSGDGACNVVDVQRVINAVSGGNCVTGR